MKLSKEKLKAEIEYQLSNIEGMVGKYCQPELGRAVNKIRRLVEKL